MIFLVVRFFYLFFFRLFTFLQVKTGNYCSFCRVYFNKEREHAKASLCIITIGLIFCSSFSIAQNAIVGTGFSSGWGGTCGSNTDFAYFLAGAGTSYTSGNLTPGGTGNQYWRIGIDWGGTIKQLNNSGGGVDAAVSPGTKYTLNSTCVTLGALYYNVPSASYRYIFKTKDAGASPTRDWVFFEVQGTPITVSSVAQLPTSGNVVGGQPVKVTATLSGTLPTGQGVYLRYTNNGYSTSTVVAMTGTATTYTATIPGSNNSGGVGCSYYIFTSGSGLSITGTDADLFSINLNNNAGSNYTYTPSSASVYKSTTSGNWNAGGTWVGGAVPPVGSPVEIQNGHNVTISSTFLDGNATTQSGNITVDAGGTLTLNPGGATFITLNGTNLIFGDYVQTTGTLAGNNGGCTFYGNCTLTAGAFNNQEYFESTSTLILNGITQTTNIWNSGVSSGIAVPYAVTISANTSLTSANYTSIGLMTVNAGKTLTIAQNLTVGDLTGSGNITQTGSNVYLTIGSANTSNTFSGIYGGGNARLLKTGTGTLTLTGDNTYTQGTYVNQGTLSIPKMANQNSNSPIGTGANLNILEIAAAGTLKYTGSGHSSGRPITLTGSGATIDASGSGLLTLSGGISGTNFNLNLTGTGTGTLTGAITTSAGTVTKTGTGTWTSNANHSYTGITYINNGTFSISTGANLGTAPGAPIANIVTLGGGTLGVTGPSWAISVNRGITLTSATSSKIDIASGVTFTCPAIITGGGNIEKTNTGILLLTGANTYTGTTTLTSGTLQLGIANAIPVAATGGGVIFNGGTLSTGSGTGYSVGAAGSTNMGTINVSASSVISLVTGNSHSLFFSASNGVSWNSASILTINGWQGTAGSSGTAGKIFIGSDATGLSATQLIQIYFTGYGPAMILSSGEIVPAAASNTRYRSRQTGVWSAVSSWEYSNDGTNWCNAGNSPTSSNGTITIRSPHTISTDASVQIDETTVNSGGTLDFSANVLLTINNGTGTDLDVSGTFKQNNGTITNNGQIVVQNGGTIEEGVNWASIPTATWNTGSNCLVTGYQGTFVGGQNQSFYNFTYNCTSQSGDCLLSPSTMSVANLFRIQSTNSKNLIITNDAASRTLTVGSFQIDNTSNFFIVGSNATASSTFNVSNNVTQTGGNFEITRSPNNLVKGTCNVLGNFTTSGGLTKIIGIGIVPGGSIDYSSLSVSGNIVISGGQLQLNSYPTAYDGRLFVGGNLTVSSGSLIYSSLVSSSSGVYFFGTGTQTFAHSAGGGTVSTSAGGVGRRFYYLISGGPTALNENYNSPFAAQTTINGTEGTIPAGYSAWPTSGSIINDVTINNSFGVTLSTNKTINGVLNLTSGSLDMNGNAIQLNNSTSNKINVTGARSIINSNSLQSYIGVTNSDLTITSVTGTSLSLGTKVELWTNKGVDFGSTFTTVNDTFRIKSNGFGLNNAPYYSSTSTLIYDCGCNFISIGPGTKEWYENTFGTNAGVPNNVIIKSGSSLNFSNTSYPHELQGSITIGGNSGSSTLTLSSNTGGDLNVGGNWTRTAFGSFNANERAVYFNSAVSPVTITANGGETFPYLFITKNAKANTVSLADSIIITKEIHFTKGTFNLANSNVVIRSTSSNTASVTNVAASADFALSYGGTGRFSIERYLPMQTPYSGRRWRLMGIPISNDGAPTISAAWQEGASPLASTGAYTLGPDLYDPAPGYGTRITNGSTIAAVSAGYDLGTTGNSSIYNWNGTGWIVPSVSDVITSRNAYLLFVRGNRSVQITNQYEATSGGANLRIKGKINTGTVTQTVPTDYYWFSNPYPSAINMRNVDYNASGSTNTYYLWDPKLLGSKNVGGWVTFSWNGSTAYTNSYDFVPNSGTGMSTFSTNGVLESGMAFMLNNTTGTTTSIAFTEASKTTGSNTIGIASRPSNPGNSVIQNNYATLYTNLFYRDSNQNTFLADGVLTGYGDGLTNDFNEMDVPKAQMFQTKEKIGLLRGDKLLAIERRANIMADDTIFLQMIKLENNFKYQLQFAGKDFANNLIALLVDKYLKKFTPVYTQGTTIYDFETSSDPASLETNRFMVVFKSLQQSPLPVRFIEVNAFELKNDNGILINWKTEGGLDIKEYQVERSIDGIHFISLGVVSASEQNDYSWTDRDMCEGVTYYRIISIGNNGENIYSRVVNVKVSDSRIGSVVIFPNPIQGDKINLTMENMPAGEYTLRFLNSIGQLVFVEKLKHQQNIKVEFVRLDKLLVKGVYKIEINGPDNFKIISEVLK